MGAKRVTQQQVQRAANSWVKRLRARGLDVPTRITAYTDLRRFDRASGIKTWERWQIMDELQRGGLNGEANATRSDRRPAIYINTNERQTRTDPRRIVIHEVLHHVRPWLPHWKVRALERELLNGRSGRLIWKAKTRAEYDRRQQRGEPMNPRS
jgi:hypothetical protein